jgi:hypothetical protein
MKGWITFDLIQIEHVLSSDKGWLIQRQDLLLNYNVKVQFRLYNVLRDLAYDFLQSDVAL